MANCHISAWLIATNSDLPRCTTLLLGGGLDGGFEQPDLVFNSELMGYIRAAKPTFVVLSAGRRPPALGPYQPSDQGNSR